MHYLVVLCICALICSVTSQRDLNIYVPAGDCLNLLIPDGFVFNCYDMAKNIVVPLENQNYDFLSAQIMSKDSKIKNLAYIDISGSLNNMAIEKPSASIVWPQTETVLSSSSFNIHVNNALNEILLCVNVVSINEYDWRCGLSSQNIISVGPYQDGDYLITLHVITNFSEIISYEHLSKYPPVSSVQVSIRSQNRKSILFPVLYSFQNLSTIPPCDPIHVFIMSVRSFDRYQEASTMIKSLLYHSDLRQPMVIHLIVDSGGYNYFLFVLQKLKRLKFLEIFIIFHDFDSVCSNPFHSFMAQSHFRSSFHHSGEAGYCRLFLPQYFGPQGVYSKSEIQLYGEMGGMLSTVWKNALRPSKLIALESDQVILSSVTELWDYFQSSEFLIAAAENYQPWMHSRPRARTREDELARSVHWDEMFMRFNMSWKLPHAIQTCQGTHHQNCHQEGVSPSLDGYQGYGIIGGVMLLRIDELEKIDFLTMTLRHLHDFQQVLSAYIKSIDASLDYLWEPKLNDQDVFNALMLYQPQWFSILPCSWNIQFHARINSLLHCTPEILYQKQVWDAQNSSETDFFQTMGMTLEDIPLSCENSRRHNIFVCEDRAKIIHYMAKSYRNNHQFHYYDGVWEFFEMLSWNFVR